MQGNYQNGYKDNFPYRLPEPWEKKLAIFPKQCCKSRVTIPAFTYAWRKKRYHGDGTVASTWWLTEEQYIFERLKGYDM